MALVCLAAASLLPVERTDKNSQAAHEQLLAKKTQGRIDVYFEGDSIARRWGATDYPQLLDNWRKNFFGWNAADFGWGADRVENILWRLQHGELDGVNPKVIVLLAGTNNVGKVLPPEGIDAAASNVVNGISAILRVFRDKAPNASIILMGVFPRNDNIAVMPEIDAINAKLSTMADAVRIRYLNINDKLADSNGKLFEGMMNAGDKLHPTIQGYQVWADALKPLLTGILGPPGTEDLAPPPTGNPGVN
jgi:lysophospholipase L1-like esterase